MNISNPFYDPHKKLRAYIAGDLKAYPTSIAKRRLAAAGIEVSRSLDKNVNIIILGEPPVGAIMDAGDEAEAALAERQAEVARAKRLNDIIARARAIGAVVVTEGVLATFIAY